MARIPKYNFISCTVSKLLNAIKLIELTINETLSQNIILHLAIKRNKVITVRPSVLFQDIIQLDFKM